MEYFEHKVDKIKWNESLQEALEVRGDFGWELVSTIYTRDKSNTILLFWKRKKRK